MATRPDKEYNKLLKGRKLMARISEDIRFLRICLKSNITPRSHEIKFNPALPVNEKQRRSMEKQLIKASIAGLYRKLNTAELNAYSSHLEMAGQEERGYNLYESLAKIQRAYECEKRRKRKIHNKKIETLLRRNNKPEKGSKPAAEEIPGFVINQSTQQFTNEQLRMLNLGLNYAVEPMALPKEDIIVDIEAAIKFIPQNKKEDIRKCVAESMEKEHKKGNQATKQELRIIKELKQKPVHYMKADKGNAVVIMDKEEYENRVMEKLGNGGFRELKTDPLPDLIKRVEKVIRECGSVLNGEERHVRMPNPCIPRMKCLPKIHKDGKEMREIIASTNAPTQNIAKWLLRKFQQMEKQPSTHSIKNYKEFITRAQTMQDLGVDDLMVSFDVKALYPSVPVMEALGYLEDWLMEQNTDTQWKYKVRQYVRLAALCVKETYFTFRGKYYKCTKGVAMGNALSGFISEIFMGRIEEKLEKEDKLPKLWIRYVDDIFAVVNKEEVEETLRGINEAHKDIKFTIETEEEGKLPFLDILVKRNGQRLGFEVYRKPTSTQRFIVSRSNHAFQHKMAAFRTMIHRMYNVPMDKNSVEKEEQYIFETARKNGYEKELMKQLMRKERKRRNRDSQTTLYKQNMEEKNTKRAAVTFDRRIPRKLRNRFKEADIEMIPTSRGQQMRTLLGTTKDKKVLGEKSGIYKVECPQCEKAYIGQTKRLITKRFMEHIKEAESARKKGRKDNLKSTIAKHIIEEGHEITSNNLSVLKEIADNRKLDVYESLSISKVQEDGLLNEDKGPGHSWLFRYLKK